jgi:thiamine biosynthesis lipoprotein
MEYHEFRAMNTDILLAAQGKPGRALAAGFARTQEFIQESERRFTRFSPDSELSSLNRSAGGWFEASAELFEVMSLARSYFEMTGGLFNPAILNALENAGYDRSMDEIRLNGAGPIKTDHPIRVPEFNQVRFDGRSKSLRLPEGMRIDLGGIAKGWIAERAARVLSGYSQACAVNAGGDLYLRGLPAGEAAWQISLEDPRDPERVLAVLNVRPGAVATSSITKRRWKQGERSRHHLIDPTSGRPAKTDWLSVTAIAQSAAMAEVYAKAILIAGSSRAKSIAPAGGEIAFIGVDGAGKMWGSENIWEYFDVANEPVPA